MADAVGVARTTISAWEKGHQPIPRWFGLALSAAAHGLGVYQPTRAGLADAQRTRRIPSRMGAT